MDEAFRVLIAGGRFALRLVVPLRRMAGEALSIVKTVLANHVNVELNFLKSGAVTLWQMSSL